MRSCTKAVLSLIGCMLINASTSKLHTPLDPRTLNRERRIQQNFCENLGEDAPPSDSTCWNYEESSAASNPDAQKGCDNPACSEAVCACDSYCCKILWDSSCRGYVPTEAGLDNPFTPGCSSSILCCEKSSASPDPDQPSFIGPKSCPSDSSLSGYSDISDLLNDMSYHKSIGSSSPVYVLCPRSTFDTSSNTINPVLDNTVIKCGEDGLSDNNCLFLGGENHITFERDVTVNNVEIHGITLTGCLDTSVRAWSQASSTAKFVDCHWKDNNGISVIDVSREVIDTRRLKNLQGTQQVSREKALHHMSRNAKAYQYRTEDNIVTLITYEPAMSIVLENCKFTENMETVGILLCVHGNIELYGCDFSLNQNGAVMIGISIGGAFIVDSFTNFSNNISGFSTIFIDSMSSHEISMDTSGEGNKGNLCDDIFFEDDESSCLDSGGYGSSCSGRCCDFNMQCTP